MDFWLFLTWCYPQHIVIFKNHVIFILSINPNISKNNWCKFDVTKVILIILPVYSIIKEDNLHGDIISDHVSFTNLTSFQTSTTPSLQSRLICSFDEGHMMFLPLKRKRLLALARRDFLKANVLKFLNSKFNNSTNVFW